MTAVGVAWLAIGIMTVCALLVAAATITRKVQERRRHQEQTRRNLHRGRKAAGPASHHRARQ